jgi:hypothetical protein
MEILCSQCNQQGIASALVPGVCTICANALRGIVIDPREQCNIPANE